MTNHRLHIPLTTSPTRSFHSHGVGELTLYGFKARLIGDDPHNYIEIQDVPEDELTSLVERIRSALSWAAVRLDFSILTDTSPLRIIEDKFFDAQFTTAHPESTRASRMRSTASHRTEEPITGLFDALKEAD